MKFERLSIYASHSENYRGSLTISEAAGSIELKLTDSQIREIISMCADSIVDIAERAANDMKDQVYKSMKEIKETE